MRALGYFYLLLIYLMFFAGLQPGLAQQGGRGNQPGGGQSGDTPRKTVPRPPPVIQPPPTRPQPEFRPEPPPVVLSGTVMLENGDPPPVGAVIEMDCGSTVTRETTVNPNGYYSFQTGQGRDRLARVMPDASQGARGELYGMDSGNLPGQETQQTSIQRLGGCDLRAQLTGYQSTQVRLHLGSLGLIHEVSPIILYPRDRVQGTTISATSLLAPKKAKKTVEKAVKAIRDDKLAEAEAQLKSAVESYPRYAEAWTHLGLVYEKQERAGEAREALKKAIALDARYVNPYVRLAWVESWAQNWAEAADLTERALALDPITFFDAYYLNVLANYNLRNFELAEKRAKQYVRLDSVRLYPRVHLVLANIAAGRNDPAASMVELQNYLKYAPNAPDAASIRARIKALDLASTGAPR